jgi:hypothetical protein
MGKLKFVDYIAAAIIALAVAGFFLGLLNPLF